MDRSHGCLPHSTPRFAPSNTLATHGGKLSKDWLAGALFELNIYGRITDVFPSAEPEPAIPNQAAQADVRVHLLDRPIYIENTVIGESQFMQRVRDDAMRHGGVTTWSGDPRGDAFEVVRRFASKARRQTARDAPNIICVSFADDHPFDIARGWAFADLLSDKRFVINPKDAADRVIFH